MLQERLAGGKVDRDHPRLVVRAQHLRLTGLNVERGDVPGLHRRNYAATVSRSAWRAIHSEPGWSVSPWAMIDTNTARAAMPRMRPPSGAEEPRTKSANVIVATPLGPNHAMNALPARSTCRAPASATK